MTGTEAYAFIDEKLDKTGTGVFEDAQKQIFIKSAANEFIVEKRKLLGRDLINDAMVAELIQSDTAVSSTLELGLQVADVKSTWQYVLEGVANGIILNPRTAAEKLTQAADPFSQNIYVGEKIYWKEEFGTSLTVTVLIKPIFSFNAGEFVNMNELAQQQILNRAVRQMMLAAEDPRYQGADQEETE